MVSKLLLAVMETVQQAEQTDCNPDTLAGLRAAYYDVRAGIGFNKAPSVYGAFPTILPYPRLRGCPPARHDGTGQECLTRIAELGIRVAQNGELSTHYAWAGVSHKPASLEYLMSKAQPEP